MHIFISKLELPLLTEIFYINDTTNNEITITILFNDIVQIEYHSKSSLNSHHLSLFSDLK